MSAKQSDLVIGLKRSGISVYPFLCQRMHCKLGLRYIITLQRTICEQRYGSAEPRGVSFCANLSSAEVRYGLREGVSCFKDLMVPVLWLPSAGKVHRLAMAEKSCSRFETLEASTQKTPTCC